MNDEQLIDYCVSQCRTPVGKISGDMIARLHELAGQYGAAEIARRQSWWQLDAAHIDAVAKTARAFLKYDSSAAPQETK